MAKPESNQASGHSKTNSCKFIEVDNSKTRITITYARLSPLYDVWGFLTESKAAGRALRLANIQDGENILEVAVGTGAMFAQILRLNPKGRNEGIDLSPDMLTIAERRLNVEFHNYNLRVGDAYNLPYPDETFDLILNNYMFDLLPEEDFSKVLQEFKRVLKLNGRMVITTMTCGRKWYNRIWDWLLKRVPWILTGCRPISLEENIHNLGFLSIHSEYISQMTFPSLIIYAEKK
jgi:ubiquinone/menaquinone biosynthesis C-methylase UbiE